MSRSYFKVFRQADFMTVTAARANPSDEIVWISPLRSGQESPKQHVIENFNYFKLVADAFGATDHVFYVRNTTTGIYQSVFNAVNITQQLFGGAPYSTHPLD